MDSVIKNNLQRRNSLMDELIKIVDAGLRSLNSQLIKPQRIYPAATIEEAQLTATEKRHAAGFMRVNHAGEICAQALYRGQALTAELTGVRDQMQQAANEEQDHLCWCQQRLRELDSHTSYLDPFWYLGSLLIGALAGWTGDRWSLGFVMATEQLVVDHLQSHLDRLPEHDVKTHAVIKQMQQDEAEHEFLARAAGGAELPAVIKTFMQLSSKLLTKTAYWL